jgi:ferredoxin-NADP reductase
MGIEHSKILEREEVAQGTMAFHLAKPAGFDFRPGQAFEIQLPGAVPGEQRGAMSRILHCQRATRE